MADAPTPVTPGMTSKVVNAISGLGDLIVWSVNLVLGLIPTGWKKYVGVLVVLLAGLWFSHSVLEWKVPSWQAECPKVVQIPEPVAVGPSKADFASLESRVKVLESRKIAVQEPQALMTGALPVVKDPKKKGTKRHVGDSANDLLTP